MNVCTTYQFTFFCDRNSERSFSLQSSALPSESRQHEHSLVESTSNFHLYETQEVIAEMEREETLLRAGEIQLNESDDSVWLPVNSSEV